ncbi:hypothetical protein [Paraliomyxa miuraensis]|uniref:hypothetical protein n=1 Tax=Paraliomyxa miuraensis TaxID=376150 RepID=UPI00224EA2B2|nr:hypothetical protein [Paraliomyxa miuraensis]MCX4245273.1 hypothetical protein [Paraliomyxa miuraensis]
MRRHVLPLLLSIVACDSSPNEPHADASPAEQERPAPARTAPVPSAEPEPPVSVAAAAEPAVPEPAAPDPPSALAPTLDELELDPISCYRSRTRKAPGLSPHTAPAGKTYLELRSQLTNPSPRQATFDGFATLRQEGPLAPQETTLMKQMAKGGSEYARFARPLTIAASDTERVAWIFLVDDDLRSMVMEVRDSKNAHRIVVPVSCEP